MTLLFVFGTRPEAIKMAPLILYYKTNFPKYKIITCITAQHREMLDEVMRFFSLQANYDLDLMRENQHLTQLTSRVLIHLQAVIEEAKPSMMIVQGDTTTAMAASLAGFYNKIPVGHVEAGLRSGNRMEPYPEEVNRKIISQIAALHFAPTDADAERLLHENVEGEVHVTGNTVIDALLIAQKNNVALNSDLKNQYSFLKSYDKFIFVTVHRRENFGKPLHDICKALIDIVNLYPDFCFVLPVHPNPNVKKVIEDNLGEVKGIFLLNPLSYKDCIWLMENSYFVLTDSGGIQEEAPAFGKPVIVMRNVTERNAGVLAGNSILAGNQYKKIFDSIEMLICESEIYESMSKAANPYGNGDASKKISGIINDYLAIR